MSYNIIEFLAGVEGQCCTHAFLAKYGITGQESLPMNKAMEISLKLGLAWTTVYRYNKLVREGKYVPCDNCKEK